MREKKAPGGGDEVANQDIEILNGLAISQL